MNQIGMKQVATKQLVAIPLAVGQAAAFAETGVLSDLAGHAVTPALTEAFGLEPGEDAERLVMLIARVAGLLGGAVVLISAETEVSPVRDDYGAGDYGSVQVPELRSSRVLGVFTDDQPGAEAAVAATLEGADLDEAWESPLVQSFLGELDLLWHHPSELATLLADPPQVS